MDSRCPESTWWSRLAAGELPAGEEEAGQGHLAGCERCRALVETLRGEEELLGRLRGAVGRSDAAEVRRRLQAAVGERYEVLEEIGRGGGGVVFRGRDVRLKRSVAIKCPGEAGQGGRGRAALQEARALAAVSQANVAAVYEVEEEGELPYIVLEYVAGRPITAAVEDWPLEARLGAFRQVLAGVQELHRRGIVHRDLKPSNILVDGSGRVKVVDLGIAASGGADGLEGLAGAAGTPAYMAPEQIEGETAQASMDVFALGVVLFEVLTGQRPFEGETAEEVMEAIRGAAPPLPRQLNGKIPGPVQAICLAALEKAPPRRYPSAREFLLDLERFAQGEPVAANPTVLADVLEHGVGRHLEDLARWEADRLISRREHDWLAGRYERLRGHEPLWVLDSRRITFSQVTLHLGAWGCVVSVLLMLGFAWEHLARWERVGLPGAVFAVLAGGGWHLWRRRTRRVALVLLLAAALSWPLLVGTVLVEMKWLGGSGQGAAAPLLEGVLSNEQLVAAAAAWVLLSGVLWRWTRTAAFALIWGLGMLALATGAMSLAGLREWLARGDYDVAAGWYLAPAGVLLLTALALDLAWGAAAAAGPLYVLGTGVGVLCLTCVALNGPTVKWLGLEGWAGEESDQIAYSVMLNGAAYLVLGLLGDRSARSRWLRRIATALFWLTPTHLLAPVAYFAEMNKWRWSVLGANWTLAELALPAGALVFVFGSVPKQMKSFFFSGLFYVAVGIVWLTHRHFREEFGWPSGLAAAGLALAALAWRRPGLFDRRAGERKVKGPDGDGQTIGPD